MQKRVPSLKVYALAGLLGLILIGAFCFWLEQAGRRQDVDLSVAYDPNGCSADYPLLVLISNRSSRVVNSVTWTFQAFVPEKSIDVADHSSQNSNVILKPGVSTSLCFRAPKLKTQIKPSQLQWTCAEKRVHSLSD